MVRMITVVVTFAIIAFADLLGQAPRTISYQGVLSDGQGKLVDDGQYQVTVRLYELPTGGTPLYSDATSVTVVGGVFNLILGDPSTPIPSSIRFDRAYYLGIAIGGGRELEPRAALTTSPYAFYAHRAGVADELSGEARVVRSINGNSEADIALAAIDSVGSSNGSIVVSRTGEQMNKRIDLRVASIDIQLASPPTGMEVGQVLSWNGTSWIPTEQAVPVGTIVAFGGEISEDWEERTGWMVCDGRRLEADKHRALAAALQKPGGGFVHGSNSDGTFFHLPDYRGLFLRGVSANRTGGFEDPDRSRRTAPNPGGRAGNDGNRVGSLQQDQMPEHTHSFYSAGSASMYRTRLDHNHAGDPMYRPINTRQSYDLNSDGIASAGSGTDNRPVNAYVYFIIKAR